MELTQDQKDKLREIIEGDAYNHYNDIVVAKEEITSIAKEVKEEFGIEKKNFNKMLKLFAEAKYDETKAQNEQFNTLYEEIFK